MGVTGKIVHGSHGIGVETELSMDEADWDAAEAVILPGGMPGTANLYADKRVTDAVRKCYDDGKFVAAICAAPSVILGGMGLLQGRRATCYPGMEDGMKGATAVRQTCVRDGNIITACGVGGAFDFACTLVSPRSAVKRRPAVWRIPRCMRLENKPELRRPLPEAADGAAAGGKSRGQSECLRAGAWPVRFLPARNPCSVMYPRRMRSIRMVSCVRRLPRGKTFACRAASRAGEMRAYHIASLDSLRTGRFGILEPDASAREVPPERIDLIVGTGAGLRPCGVPLRLRRRILRPLYDTDAGRSGCLVRGGAFVGTVAAHGVRSALRLDFYRKAGAAHG